LANGPAWDPFFFFPHTIDSLFLAAFCYLYLQQGAPQSIVLLTAHLSLKLRVKRYGGIIFDATFKASQERMWDELVFAEILGEQPKSIAECSDDELAALAKSCEGGGTKWRRRCKVAGD